MWENLNEHKKNLKKNSGDELAGAGVFEDENTPSRASDQDRSQRNGETASPGTVSFDKKDFSKTTLAGDSENIENSPAQDHFDIIGQAASSTNIFKSGPRFIFEKLMGFGGMCNVYAARDLCRVGWGDVNPFVAVKKLLPDFTDNRQAQMSLAQEFAIGRHLCHPGIIRFYDLHEHEGEVCLSMELTSSLTLREYIADKEAECRAKACRLAYGIFDALGYMHDCGLVHADLKPGNIFIKQDYPVIFDFNISTVEPKAGQTAASPMQAMLESKFLAGYTKCYASLERLQGGRPSQADDIYAACCTVYELAAGFHPYNRWSAFEAAAYEIVPVKPEVFNRRQWQYLLAGLNAKPGKRPEARELCQVFMETGGFMKKIWKSMKRMDRYEFTKSPALPFRQTSK